MQGRLEKRGAQGKNQLGGGGPLPRWTLSNHIFIHIVAQWKVVNVIWASWNDALYVRICKHIKWMNMFDLQMFLKYAINCSIMKVQWLNIK